jgi:isoleucyl-tRNA synthetase
VDAYDTLYTALHTLCLISAPLLPLLSEHVYRGLTGERSVHLADWPLGSAPEASAGTAGASAAGASTAASAGLVALLPRDTELVASMDTVREVCSAGHSVRKAAGLRARLPLQAVAVAGAGAAELGPFVGLIAEELNVKEVHLVSDVAEVADLVLQLKPAVLGPRLGPATQEVIAAVRKGSWKRLADGGIEVAGHELGGDEYFLSLVPKDQQSGRALPGNEMVVSLELKLSPELEAEGLARDVVRQVQEARKRGGFDVSDHIRLTLGFAGDLALQAAVGANRELVAGETLAGDLVLVEGSLGNGAERASVADGRYFEATVERLKL